MKCKGVILTGSIVIFILILVLSALASTTPAVWGNLTPGEYGVGFKSVEKYDNARVFQPKYDYFGAAIEGERARPIQINIWYPSAITADELTMVYGEYAFPYPEDISFIEHLSQLQNREINHLFQILRANAPARGFFDNNMAGVSNANPAEGTFPLIIYHPNITSGYIDNVIMCEYLASHGFIVATTHPVGHSQLMPEVNARDIETQVRDAEFIFEYMKSYPQFNRARIGSLGFGSGGFVSLLFQMRNSDIDAVAGLGNPYTGASYFNLIQGNSFYGLDRVQIPLMHMYFEPESEPVSMALVDSIIYSDRYSYSMTGVTINNLNFDGYIASTLPDTTQPEKRPGDMNYEIVCQYVHHFFDAILNDNEDSKAFIGKSSTDNNLNSDIVTVTFQEANEIPPTSNQFMVILQQHGVSKAVELFDHFNKLNPGSILIPEANFNAMGYRLINQGQVQDACHVMRINAESYPNHANCWDSYADALIAAGDNAKAAECYRKVLEVVDNDETINENLRTTIRNNANNFLNNLNQEENN